MIPPPNTYAVPPPTPPEIDDDLDQSLKDMVERYQTHGCTFSCHKKKKKLTIRKDEGWGVGVKPPKNSEELVVPVCRFGFARPPSDETIALLGFSEDEDETTVLSSKKDYLGIRKFLLRSTYTPKGEKREDQPLYQQLIALSFKEFLQKVGMYQDIHEGSEEEQLLKAKSRYHSALRAGIKGQVAVFGKRDLKSLFINNYNPKLMELIQANHDLQYCGDPYSVAQYACGYLTKAEAGMSALLKKIDEEFSHLPEVEKVKKFAACLDKHREVSIQEAVYRLLGLTMAKFSVRVKYVNTSLPSLRDGLLRRDLDNVDDDDSIFYPSIHMYYEARPDTWEEKVKGHTVKIDGKNMCLADWFSLYDHFASGKPSQKGNGVLFQGKRNGWFRRRRQRAVLRYFLRQEDEKELARGLCILFLPFRNELTDIHSKDPTELLAEHGQLINENRARFESSSLIQDYIERLEKEREKGGPGIFDDDDEEEEEDDEETTEAWQIEEHQREYDRSQAIASLPKDFNATSMLELRKGITSLNTQQRIIFDELCERSVCDDSEAKGSQVYLAGEAGTGKSYVIKTFVPAVKYLSAKSGQDLDKPSVLVLAPSATAAFLVDGKTIESGLGFMMSKHRGYPQGNPDKVSKMAFEYEDVVWIICEEISMVGSNKHLVMNYKLQEMAQGPQKNEFMGGKHILAVGDFRQLPPVKDIYIFENARIDGRPSIAPNLWRERYEIYYLTQKMRCPDDLAFAQLCDRVGKNQINEQDVTFFNSRCISEEIPEELDNENFRSGEVTIIVTTNVDKDRINLSKLRTLLPALKEYVSLSDDKITNSKYNIPLPDCVSFTRKGQMMKNLVMRVGAPVAITTNHTVKRYKEDGLTNGAYGYIDFIQHSDDDEDMVEIIWVRFRDERVGKRHYKAETRRLRPRKYGHLIHEESLPILPARKQFEARQGNDIYMRKQFPLTLAYAITAHKAQGATLKKVIIDFRGSDSRGAKIDNSSFYTAITRVTNGNNLFLRSFEKRFIRNDPRVEFEINRMRTLKNLKFRKVYLREPIFVPHSNEIKVGYLNINALRDSYHSEYLNGDHNLLHLDILAIAETHLQASTSTATLSQVLNNWHIVERFDSDDNTAHMGLLLLSSKANSDVQILSKQSLDKAGQCHAQIMTVLYSGHKFSFVYIRLQPTLSEARWLHEKTIDSDYVIGDLNLDPLIPSHKTLIDEIGGDKVMLLREATTRTRKQLDHILGHNTTCSVFTTSFLNFISDHHSITLRLAPQGTDFVKDDQRLKKDKKTKDNQNEAPQPLTPGTIRKKTQIKKGQTPKKLRSVN